MKKNYIKPEIELVEFDVIDEITAIGDMDAVSGDETWED